MEFPSQYCKPLYYTTKELEEVYFFAAQKGKSYMREIKGVIDELARRGWFEEDVWVQMSFSFA